MTETTTTKKSEFVFRRLGDSFDQLPNDIWHALPKWLGALVLLFIVARIVVRYSLPANRPAGIRDATAFGVVWGMILWVTGLLGYTAAMAWSRTFANEKLEQTERLLTLGGLGLAVFICFGAILAVFAFTALRLVRYAQSPTRASGEAMPLGLAWGSGLAFASFVFWGLIAFYNVDGDQSRAAEAVSSIGTGNAARWYTFTGALFLLGSLFVVLMYIKDTKTVSWFWAVPLALLRMTVYAILCGVFLLPAMQTWEDTNKQSRVVILLDITPSVTQTTDEIGTGPGRKAKYRMDIILDFLTDEKVAFLKNLLEKNPVAIYAFGARLDESPWVIAQDEPAWSRAEWEAFARYDFKPWVLRGLSDEGKDQLKKMTDWNGDKPGDPNWAQTWVARGTHPDLQKLCGLSSADDASKLKKNLERLDKRIKVAQTIAQGTNVVDSITDAINRESANMVQGIIVFSDGRSNLGSESAYTELRERASREKIPVFTVAVGEERTAAAITITDLNVQDSNPIDEAWKIVVEADGVNLAKKEVEVSLDMWLPGRDMKKVPADHTLKEKLTFEPGDPPHGQTEFVIDPAKLPEKLTTESKDAAIKKRVLKEGKWSVRARIAKDPLEAFPDPEHVRDRPDVNVVQRQLRILLFATPGREFFHLRTLLVREVQDKRATLTTYVQNEAGTTNKITAEEGELLIQHFPDRLDLSNKTLPADRVYNLNEYDVIVAFDPDWSELNQSQADDLGRWVKEGGGGLIFAAGPINTFQLAPGREVAERMKPLLDILPVIPADIVAQRIKASPKTPRRLYLYPEKILGSEILKIDNKVTVAWNDGKSHRAVGVVETLQPGIELRLHLDENETSEDLRQISVDRSVLISVAQIQSKSGEFKVGERVSVEWTGRTVLGVVVEQKDKQLRLRRDDGKEELIGEDQITAQRSDPKGGWERFFTDRDEYQLITDTNPDNPRELYPHRGFFSCYPVIPILESKPNSAVLADFVDENDDHEKVLFPWIVVNNPSAPYRSAFLASPELHKMRSYEPDEHTGREYFERFWVKLMKYVSAKRNVKAPRGRLMVSKEGVSSAPLRVQARILNDSAKPYPIGAASPKFKIVQEAPNGEKREFGPFNLTEKQSAGAFEGYYAGQEVLDPKVYPPGTTPTSSDYLYRVVIDVPDSNGETLQSEFRIRSSDPELDNTKPDFVAMLRMASEFDETIRNRLSTSRQIEFGRELPKESGVPKLAFKIDDRKLLPLIPEFMKPLKTTQQNRGPVEDLWDKPLKFTVWTRLKLTDEGVKELQQAKVPDAVLLKLNSMKDKEFSREQFEQQISQALSDEEAKQFQSAIVDHATVRTWEVRLLDFELTPLRANVGVWLVFITALSLMLARVVWAAVAHMLPPWLWMTLVILWLVMNLVGLLVMGALVAFDVLDWWPWVISIGLVAIALVVFRATWWVALIGLGALAATSVILGVCINHWDYSGTNVVVSFALPAIVSLLCVEWTARKLLRLA